MSTAGAVRPALFSICLALACLALFHGREPAASPARSSRQITLTFDDLPGVVLPQEGTGRLAEVTKKLVSAISSERVPAIGFVNEGKLGPEGVPDPERAALLEKWLDHGLELGNHTFSHVDLHRVSLEAFQQDAVRGEPVTRRLLEARGMRLRFFRHPFLHTGRSLEIRCAVESSLARRASASPLSPSTTPTGFSRGPTTEPAPPSITPPQHRSRPRTSPT